MLSSRNWKGPNGRRDARANSVRTTSLPLRRLWGRVRSNRRRASSIHGSSRATFDLDLVYDRSDENLTRVVDALAPLHPYLRGAPPGLPFRFDFKTLQNGLNFTLTSDLGDIDLFGEVPGGGVYQNLLQESIKVRLSRRCLNPSRRSRLSRHCQCGHHRCCQ